MIKNAKWLWYDDPGYDLVNSWMQARRTFKLKSVPAKVIIQVTADALYRLYVNGKHVNRGPARGFQESWPYDRLDIAPFLKKGKNVIAVLVHNYGVGTFQYVHRGCAGLLLGGKIGSEDISSGRNWRIRPAPGFKRVITRVSLQLGFQEFFDARLDDDSWLLPGYDDSLWNNPMCRNFGSIPWPSLEERGIPLFREKSIIPRSLVSKSTGKCEKNFLDSTNVVTLFLDEKKKWQDTSETLRRTKTWATIQVRPTGRNNYAAYCIDFGKEVIGSLRLAVEGTDGREVIDTIFCEGLEGKGPAVNPPALEICRMAFGNRLFARAGKTEHEQFNHWGFRYLVLIVRNSTKKLNIRVRLHGLSYPLDVKADFQSSNKKLDSIYEISAWTQQCCMLDAYVDCPWREQVQWWGDARVQAANTFYLSADTRLFKRGIRQLGTQEVVENGLSYGHAPTIAHNCILPDFTLTWIITHRDYYWQTGDLSLFKDMRDRLHRAFDYFHKATAENGLLPHDKRYWLFLDWCPIFKDGYPTLYNLFYLMALRIAVELFKLSGDSKSARLYAGREKALASAIKEKLFNAKAGVFYGGLSWKNKPVTQDSAQVFSFAILLDLFPEYHKTFTEKYLLPLVKGDRETSILPLPSPFFMHYIFEALKKRGHTEEVIDCIERWWGKMVSKGLTTTEEVWDAKPGSESLCHAWSAHPIVHLSNILLGIRQEKPGWKEVRFSPTFSHADYVRGKVATPQGTIEAGWKRTKDKIECYLSLPPGITGKISLPGKRTERTRGRGKWVVNLT